MLFCFAYLSVAQQNIIFSQYGLNLNTYNPAAAGCNEMINVFGTFRSQYAGLEGAPITYDVSTGGVGDKITLMFLPLMAAAGIYTAKLSGRGLGHTGGTIDKLESIPNFRTDLAIDEFKNKVKEHKTAIAAQTLSLAPADGKLYALRDVTSTVDIIPLIASLIAPSPPTITMV